MYSKQKMKAGCVSLALVLFSAFALECNSLHAANEIITVDGGGAANGPDGGPALGARIDAEHLVFATDQSGDYYISETDFSTIRKVSGTTGIITTIAGTSRVAGFNGDGIPAKNALLCYPVDIALDNAGNLYLADNGNHRIRKIDAVTGIITTIAGTGEITDNGDGGLAENAAIAYPGSLAFDSSGNLYFTSGNSLIGPIETNEYGLVRRIDGATGIITTVAGKKTPSPYIDNMLATASYIGPISGMTVDGVGNVYLAEESLCKIHKVNATTGIITTIAGNGSRNASGDGGLAINAGIGAAFEVKLGPTGNIVFIDFPTIRQIDNSTGIINTIAGNGINGYAGSGKDSLLAETGPTGIAFGKNGLLYTAELSFVRRIGPFVIPDTPQNLSISGNVYNAVYFQFYPDIYNSSDVVLERAPASTGIFSEISITPFTQPVIDFTVVQNTSYLYRIRFTNGVYNSLPSNVVAVTTPPGPPPSPPTGLTATALSGNEIDLNWIDQGYQTEILIERRDGLNGPFVQIAALNGTPQNFADTTVSPLSQYFYRISASNGFYTSGYSNIASVTTLIPAPVNLAAFAISAGEIDLNWTNTPNQTYVYVERSTGGAFSQIAQLGGTISAYSDTAVNSGTAYVYRVKASFGAATSGYSNSAGAATLSVPAPSNLTASASSNSEIDLAWTNNASGQTSVLVERAPGISGTSFTQIAALVGGSTMFNDFGLPASTAYTYRVRVVTGAGTSTYSPAASATTTSVAPPNAPISFTVTINTTNQASLSWFNTNGSQSAVYVERKLTNGGAYSLVATLAGNASAFVDQSLTENSAYTYHLRVAVGASLSPYSAEAGGLTLPSAPASLTATPVSPTQATLSWSNTTNNPGGSQVLVEREQGSFGFFQVKQLAGTSTTVNDTSIQGNTQYTYRIRTSNTTGNSVYSNLATLTTLPAAPTGLSAFSSSPTKITLSWSNSISGPVKIERKNGAGGIYVQINTVTNTNSFADTGLTPNTQYYYRVRVTGITGDSPYSNEANATTKTFKNTFWTTSPVTANTLVTDPTNSLIATFTAGNIGGQYSVSAQDFNYNLFNLTASPVTVISPPLLLDQAEATLDAYTSASVILQVAADDAQGESNLTYTWSVTWDGTGTPPVTFTDNGTNSAKFSTALLGAAGNYSFTVTITNPSNLSTSSTATLNVPQVVSGLSVTPANVVLQLNGTQHFIAAQADQFGQPVTGASLVALAWGTDNGSIDSNGVLTAGEVAGGPFHVTAVAGAATGVAIFNISDGSPTVVIEPASVQPGGTSTQLSATVTDDGGLGNLTYAWSAQFVQTSGTSADSTVAFNTAAPNTNLNPAVTFTHGGTYILSLTVTDASSNSTTDSTTLDVPYTPTTIAITPSQVTVATGSVTPFTATVNDQFSHALTMQPAAFVWMIGNVTQAETSAVLQYNAGGASGGPFAISAAAGGVTGTASVSVAAAPVIASVSASPNPTGTTTSTLSATAQNDTTNQFTYYWDVTDAAYSSPDPVNAAFVSFDAANGSHAGSSLMATFTQAGSYPIRVTVTDPATGLKSTGGVTVAVNPALTSIIVSAITPDGPVEGYVQVGTGGSQLFSAAGFDQFSMPFTISGAVTWGISDVGAGAIDSSGVFAAGGAVGNYTVSANYGGTGGVTGLIALSVVGVPPQITSGAKATVTGTQVQLSVTASDPNGLPLTYLWSIFGPGGATFSDNNSATASSSIATLSQAGDYTFAVAVTNSVNQTVFSSTVASVTQTLTQLNIAPGTVIVYAAQQQFSAAALDQFGNPMNPQPDLTWSVTGGGTIDDSGLLTAANVSGGPYSVTGSVRDSGESATATFWVQILDVTPPTITTPSDMTVAAVQTGTIVNYTVSASDDVSAPANITILTDPPSGSVFPIGTSTVNVTAIDEAGNVASATFNVTVTATLSLARPTVPLTIAPTPSGAYVDFTATPTGMANPVVTYSQNPGTLFPIGTTTVTATATDDFGNILSDTFDVVVVADVTGPTFDVPVVAPVEATGPDGALVYFPLPVVIDDTTPFPLIYSDHASGSLFPLGKTTVTLTALDDSLNETTKTFVVTVKDTTPPVISSDGSSAYDIVSGIVPVTYMPPLPTDGKGWPNNTQVTATAMDAAKNSSSLSFTGSGFGLTLNPTTFNPVASKINPPSGSTVNTKFPDIHALITGLSPIAFSQITLDGTVVVSNGFEYATPSNKPLTEGSHTVVFNQVIPTTTTPIVSGIQNGSWSFTVDVTPPVISGLSPASGSTLSTARPTISAIFSDNIAIDTSKTQVWIQSVNVAANAGGFTYMPGADMAEGQQTVLVKIFDFAGNMATASTTFTIKLSTSAQTTKGVEAPTLGALQIAFGKTGDKDGVLNGEQVSFSNAPELVLQVHAGTNLGNIDHVTFTGSNGVKTYSVTASGKNNSADDFIGSLILPDDGRYELTASATVTDGTTTVSGSSKPITVIVCRTPPALNFALPMRYSMTDTKSMVFINGNHGAAPGSHGFFEPGSNTVNQALRDYRNVNCYSEDEFGCYAAVSGLPGLSPTLIQQASLTGPDNDPVTDILPARVYTDPVNGQSIAFDPPAGSLRESIEVDAGANVFAPYFGFKVLNGLYTYHVKVTDRCGNILDKDMFRVWVDKTPPKVASYSGTFGTNDISREGTTNKGVALWLTPSTTSVYSNFDAAEVWQDSFNGGKINDSNLLFKAHRSPTQFPGSSYLADLDVSQWYLLSVLNDIPDINSTNVKTLNFVLRDHAGNFSVTSNGNPITMQLRGPTYDSVKTIPSPGPGSFTPYMITVPPSFAFADRTLPVSFGKNPPERVIGIAPLVYTDLTESGAVPYDYAQWFWLGDGDPDQIPLTRPLTGPISINNGDSDPRSPDQPFDFRNMEGDLVSTIRGDYTANAIHLSPDVVSAGQTVTFRVSAGFLSPQNANTFLVASDSPMGLSKLALPSPTAWNYVTFVDSKGNSISGDPSETDPVKLAKSITILKDSSGKLRQRLIFDPEQPSLAQTIELTCSVGPLVGGLTHVDVNLGLVHAYNGSATGLGGAHRMVSALNVLGVSLLTDANHDGTIDGKDLAPAAAPQGVTMLCGFGLAHHPALEDRIEVDVGSMNSLWTNAAYKGSDTAVLTCDNPRVKIYDAAQNGTDITGKTWTLSAASRTAPPTKVWLDFNGTDQIANLKLTYTYAPPASPAGSTPPTPQVFTAALKIVRLSNGLGMEEGLAPRTAAFPGYATVELMRGNLYFGSVARTYSTPATGPGVMVSYNHLDGIATGLGVSWRTNYDLRIFDSSYDKNNDGTITADERAEGDLLTLIDETGRRYVFQWSVQAAKFKSMQSGGMQAATVEPIKETDASTGQMVVRYKLIRNDNRIAYFDVNGFLIRIEDLMKKKLTVCRTKNGNAYQVKDEYGRSEDLSRAAFEAGFTATDNPRSLGGRQLCPFTFGYDTQAHERITSLTSQGEVAGAVTNITYTIQYDTGNKVQTIHPPQPQGGIDDKVITYTPAGKPAASTSVSVAEHFGGNTLYTIDGNSDTWSSMTDPMNVNTVHAIDVTKRQLTDSTTGRYHVTIGYDSIGNINSRAVSGGTTMTYVYSAFGMEGANLIQTSTLAGANAADGPGIGSGSSTYDYYMDALEAGRVKTMTEPVGDSTSYVYDANGFMTNFTDVQGFVWTVSSVDSYGNPTTIVTPQLIDGSTRTAKKVYSSTGLLKSETDAMQYTTTYNYDNQNRLTRTTVPGGAYSSTDYDPLGHVTSSIDLVQRTTTFQHDQVGRVTKSAPPELDPTISVYSYQKGAATTQVVNTSANRTLSTETMDAGGRIMTSVSPSVLLPVDAAGVTTDITTGNFYTTEGWVDYTTNGKNKQTKYTYDNAGRVKVVTTPGGGTTNTEYHSCGWIKSITNTDKQTITYGYDANGRNYKVTNNASGSVTTNYVQGLVMSMEPSPSGNNVSYTYDNDNTLRTVTDVFGKVHLTNIDVAGKTITTIVDNNDSRKVTVGPLDYRGFATKYTTPLGVVQMGIRSDGMGESTQEQGRDNVTIKFDGLDRSRAIIGNLGKDNTDYNPHNGDLIGRTNSLNLRTTLTWEDSTGELKSLSDNVLTADVGAISRSEASPSLPLPPTGMPGVQPLPTQQPSNLHTIVERDKNGNILRYKDAMDRLWTQNFDDDDRLSYQKSPDGIETTIAYYNPGGTQINTVTEAGEITTFNYDNLGNVIFVQTPAGVKQSAEYDEFGRIKSSTTDGLKTQYTYDPMTKVLTDIDEPGGLHGTRNTHYTHDDFGRVHFMTDPNGKSTMYDYNDLDQLKVITYFDNSTELFDYYPNGDLEWHTGRDLRKEHMHYDLAGRIVSTDLTFGNGASAGTVTYGYNSLDQVSTETYTFGATTTTVQKSFDARGRMKNINGSAGLCTYSYNNDDTILTKTYPGESLNYYYDRSGPETGRLRAILGNRNGLWISYNAQGRIQQTSTATASTQALNQAAQVYESVVSRNYVYTGELVQTMTQKVAGAASEQFSYTYDSQNNSARLKILSGPLGNLQYDYDAAGRLYSEAWDGANAYSQLHFYDDNDNRTDQITTDGTGVSSRHFEYDSMNMLNHITGAETTDFGYDMLGRMTSRTKNDTNELTLYAYDRLDRLTNVDSFAQTDTHSTYGYAGSTWMRNNANVVVGTSAAVTTAFTFDGFACTSKISGGTQTSFGVPGDSPLWESTGGTMLGYAQDGKGSVSGTADMSGYLSKFKYDAYGNTTSTDASGNSTPNTSGPRYRSEWYDAETDQYDLRNRYYQPGTTRFDTVDQGGDSNPYAYCGSEPNNRSDPMGTYWEFYFGDDLELHWNWNDEHQFGDSVRKPSKGPSEREKNWARMILAPLPEGTILPLVHARITGNWARQNAFGDIQLSMLHPFPVVSLGGNLWVPKDYHLDEKTGLPDFSLDNLEKGGFGAHLIQKLDAGAYRSNFLHLHPYVQESLIIGNNFAGLLAIDLQGSVAANALGAYIRTPHGRTDALYVGGGVIAFALLYKVAKSEALRPAMEFIIRHSVKAAEGLDRITGKLASDSLNIGREFAVDAWHIANGERIELNFASQMSGKSESMRDALDAAIRQNRVRVQRPPRHHIFPQEFRDWFLKHSNFEIDDYTIELTRGVHDAIHKFLPGGLDWNSAIMSELVNEETKLGRQLTKREILRIGNRMRRNAGLSAHKVMPYGR